jgi:hypothetical protein
LFGGDREPENLIFREKRIEIFGISTQNRMKAKTDRIFCEAKTIPTERYQQEKPLTCWLPARSHKRTEASENLGAESLTSAAVEL